jgi:hypothetical protein
MVYVHFITLKTGRLFSQVAGTPTGLRSLCADILGDFSLEILRPGTGDNEIVY